MQFFLNTVKFKVMKHSKIHVKKKSIDPRTITDKNKILYFTKKNHSIEIDTTAVPSHTQPPTSHILK